MKKISIFFVSLFFIIGCSKDEVLVTINGNKFTLSDLKSDYQLAPSDDSVKIMGKVDDFINNKLILIEAKKQGYENDPVVMRAFETSRKDVIWRGYYEAKVIDKIKVSESAVRKIYNQITDQYHLAMIVQNNDSIANYISSQLKNGVPFDSLIKYSLDTLSKTGDIGSFSAISIPEELLKSLKRTKTGGVAGPVKFGDFIYFLKVIEHKKSTTPAYKDVSENIRNNLKYEEAKKKGEEFVDKIIKEAKVEYNQEGLDILLKPDSLITEKDLETWVVKKYDTSFVKVRTVIDAIRYQYKQSSIEPKVLIERELVPDLIYDAALKANAENLPQIKSNLQKTLDNLIHQKFYSDRVLEKVQIDSQMVANYFQQHKSDYPDKKLADVYTVITARLREMQVDSLRKILFDELRKKYQPQINEKVLVKLLTKEEK
uniref:peptidylprolyl isomerase n=1 Tax=candidate division WOR-3 bacterium TaxID=2052148 RepID=A0A7C4XVI4_UNCW3